MAVIIKQEGFLYTLLDILLLIVIIYFAIYFLNKWRPISIFPSYGKDYPLYTTSASSGASSPNGNG